MATPFVQGRLRDKYLKVIIDTACAHCGRPMRIHLDSAMRFDVDESDAEPLLFEPDVDWRTFKGANILDAY